MNAKPLPRQVEVQTIPADREFMEPGNQWKCAAKNAIERTLGFENCYYVKVNYETITIGERTSARRYVFATDPAIWGYLEAIDKGKNPKEIKFAFDLDKAIRVIEPKPTRHKPEVAPRRKQQTTATKKAESIADSIAAGIAAGKILVEDAPEGGKPRLISSSRRGPKPVELIRNGISPNMPKLRGSRTKARAKAKTKAGV